VLNSLAGTFVDASLDLVARGGRFVELGKTDIRDPERLATTHPHLTYQVVDLHPHAGPDRIGEMLDELLPLFRAGTLTPIPVTAYGIRHAARAFRLMQNAGHTGKIVLTFPRPLDPDGTVLITGGTGTLGGLLARHLVTAHGVRHLVLASRRGPQGADELRADLERAGATVTITACDVADPDALDRLLGAIPLDHPLTGVFHTAGVLADGTIASLTADDFEKVFAPKADAAWQLHERTRHLDLAAFVLYSSTSATFGNPGQANYVAANTFLDALAHERARRGLPGTSVAWGWWQPVSGLTGELTGTDNARIARTGLAPISAEHGHALLDAALELPHPVVTASPLNQRTLRANAGTGTLHPVLERLAPAQTTRQSTTTGSAAALRDELATLAPDARLRRLRTTITTHAAAVLGLDDPAALPPEQPFRSFGFDSLTALELRNRLATATSLQLPATLTYDHPSPDELAAHLDTLLFPDGDEERPAEDEDTRIREVISSIPLSRLRELGLLDGLLRAAAGPAPALPGIEDISTASLDELVALAMAEDES
jgi:coronafacic acid polyketide synthase Cfa6